MQQVDSERSSAHPTDDDSLHRGRLFKTLYTSGGGGAALSLVLAFTSRFLFLMVIQIVVAKGFIEIGARGLSRA